MHDRELEGVAPEGVTEALKRLAEADAAIAAPARVEAALMSAFRENSRERKVVRMRPPLRMWAAAAAAAVLVLAAVRISVTGPAAPQPLAPPAAQTEVATPFYALVPGFDPDAVVYHAAVRVEMPRTVLAAYGLPVNVDRIDIPIQADLLIGDDGTARAIRFVSTPAD